jgi:DNA-binding CsgD family transcriptional regulator
MRGSHSNNGSVAEALVERATRSMSPALVRRSHQGCGLLDVLHDDEWRKLVTHLRLSPREADVARSVIRNEKVNATACQLGLSPHTVHTYRERLFRKLGIGSSLEFVTLLFTAYVLLRGPRNGTSP